MEINETEVITNCQNSMGILSKKTIVTNHPWIKDVEAELEQIAIEEEEALSKLEDTIPGVEEDTNEE